MNPSMLSHSLKWKLVLFFVMFTLADISLPGFCRTDDHSQRHNFNSSGAVHFSVLQQDMDGGSACHSSEEDCFCCCSHILPYSESIDTCLGQMGAVEVVRIEEQQLPSSLLIYHPPRIV